MNEKRGGLYEQRPGVWRISVNAGRDPVSGEYVRIRETVKSTKTEAKRRRNELLGQAQAGTITRSTGETVADYLERYVGHRQKLGKVRPRTAEVYRGYVRRDVTPLLGTIRLSEVRPDHVQGVLDSMLDRGLRAASVVQVHRILHGAFKQAVRWRLLSVNPSDGVTPPTIERPELEPPDGEKIARLLAATDERFRSAVALAATTGMRRGEIAGLRWSNVALDSDDPALRVAGSLQRADGELRVVPPKTPRAYRTIPLPPSVVGFLKRHRTHQNERRLLAGPAWTNSDHVFDSGTGAPLDPDRLTGAFRRAAASAGLSGVRLHDLRHAFATLQMDSGTNPRLVSDLLGHAQVSFTLQTYAHPDRKSAAAAMALSDAVVGDPWTNPGTKHPRR